MDTKFTKGEWRVGMSRGSYSVSSLMDKGNSSRVCDLDYYGNNKANAHLIAAAPDMYAMIKELAHELNLAIDECNEYRAKAITPSTESEPDYIDKQTVHEAQVLLAKARGES